MIPNTNKKSIFTLKVRPRHVFRLIFCVFLFALPLSSLFSLLSSPATAHASVVATSLVSPLSKGLVGYWTFDGKNMVNNVADSSGSGNNGDLVNFTSTSSAQVQGRVGQGISFNGVNSYVKLISDPIASNNSLNTICAWALIKNIASVGGGSAQTLVGLSADTNNRISLQEVPTSAPVKGALQVSYTNSGTDVSSATTIAVFKANQWVHVCSVVNGLGISLFANGVSIATTSATTLASIGNTIGSENTTPIGVLGGTLDDVRIYSRALSQTEISQLYSMGSATHVATSPTKSLTTGLVGYWTFDGKNMVSNVADVSGNGNNGSMNGFTSTSSAVVQGKIGQGLSFDGSTSYVNVSNLTSDTYFSTTTFTVSFWMKTTSANTDVQISKDGNQSGWRFYLTSGTVCSLTKAGGGNDGAQRCTSSTVNNNKWHHIVGVITTDSVTLGNNNAIMYLDGVLNQGSITRTNPYSPSNVSVQIGRRNADRYFSGSLDDVRIYNYALSTTSIQQLYSMGSATHVATSPSSRGSSGQLASGLVGYWTFDGKNMVNNVADSSGSGNTAYLNLGTSGNIATSTGAMPGKVGQGFNFDGIDDYATTSPINLTSTKIATVSFWMYKRSFNNKDGLAFESSSNAQVNDGAFFFDVNSQTCSGTGGLEAYLQDSVGTGKFLDMCFTKPSLNKWHHYDVIYDNSTILGNVSLYIDGVAQTANSMSSTKDQSSNLGSYPWYFMSRGGTSLRNEGSLDDVRIYNYALSTTSIQQLYQVGR